MKLLNELIADYDMICDIKERYEEMNISNKDKIVSAANSLMECFENLIVTTEEIIAENNYNTINTENDNYQKHYNTLVYYRVFLFYIFLISSIIIVMKKILIGIIKIYQKIPGPWHGACRHIPTCSNYAIEAIETYGSLKGSKMAIGRIIRCNPWGTSGYDPVIKEEKHEKNN